MLSESAGTLYFLSPHGAGHVGSKSLLEASKPLGIIPALMSKAVQVEGEFPAVVHFKGGLS